MSDAPVDEQGDTPTLESLCTDLGPELLDVVLAPMGLDVPARDVVLHDPLDQFEATVAVGDVVLGVGLSGADDTALSAVQAAGQARIAALVLKRREEPSRELLRAAQGADVAVLATSPDVRWGELYGLVRAALSADVSRAYPRSPGAMSGDLLSLADATAAVTGGSVLFEDTRGYVLAFSQHGQDVDHPRSATILRRRVSDEWMGALRRSGVIKKLIDTDDVVEVHMFGVRRRVIAIRSGPEVLGFIYLAGDTEALSPSADDGLREAAKIAALHLMRERVFDDIDRRARSGMVRALLRGDGEPEAMLSRLGFPSGCDLRVVAIDVDESPSAPGLLERAVVLVVEHLAAFRWQASATALNGRVYVLVALSEGTDGSALNRTVADCLTRLGRALGGRLRAGMSMSVPSADDLPFAHRRAGQCLDLGPSAQQIVTFEEIHGRALLAEMDRFLADHPSAVSPVLRILIDADRQRNSAYVPTLRAYLAALGDAVVAAQRLRIHVNTLRYRIRRIVQLTGLDLTDADTRLALELQLRMLSSPPTPP